MTTAAATELAALLRQARALLLDFDGPICAIFAGHPAPLIARQLAADLVEDGAVVPARVRNASDPFDVLRYAATLGDDAAQRLEAKLRSAEIAAVPTAKGTPGAESLIDAWSRSGRPVAAVSNNSEFAVGAYLQRHHPAVSPVVGRTSADPSLLKPNPHLVLRALDALRTQPGQTMLVGDSPSDMEAGRRAGVPTIGFANKPGKENRLIAAGARFVVRHLAELEHASQIAPE